MGFVAAVEWSVVSGGLVPLGFFEPLPQFEESPGKAEGQARDSKRHTAK